jgi:hypothetical protein
MKITLKVNEYYICAELGGGIYFDNGIPIIANRPVQGIWEEFNEVPLSSGKFALRTYDGHYVTAEDNYRNVSTNRTEIGIWEQFTWDSDRIKTFHGTYLDLDEELILIQSVDGISIKRIELEAPLPIPDVARKGLVVAEGQCAKDSDGIFHPLGVTFFWALFGWKYERARIHQHLSWLSQYPIDYLRILCEVNWPGRSIDPNWSDYQTILSEFIDCAYNQYGFRTQLTLVGGKVNDLVSHANQVLEVVNHNRQEKVIHYEVCNEWRTLDKMNLNDLINTGKLIRQNSNNLVALSTPSSHSGNSIEDMIKYTQQAGCNMFVYHPRRSNHDQKWSAVRQGYDCKNFPYIVSLNEPQGPQSSVASLDNPMQLAMSRATSIICGGAPYVLHVAQGVTGIEQPEYGRPMNMWEVPNIDSIIRTVCSIDNYLPTGIENWTVKNNSSSSHPFPLDPRIGYGFWEGNTKGSVNKNYSTINGNKFMEVLLGVNNESESGMTLCGNARQNSNVLSFDTEKATENHLTSGQPLYLRGRKDKMKGYILAGNI